MAQCQCTKPSVDHDGRCKRTATEVRVRDGQRVELCGDCTLSSDKPEGDNSPNELHYNRGIGTGAVHVPVADKPRKPKVPSIATMERWVMDGVAKATDGCRVEPDGHCSHGKPSWLLKLGLI